MKAPIDFIRRHRWAALLILAAISYFAFTGSIGLIGPDEPRYAQVTREIGDDLIVPQLWGQPWFEKPPLLYWSGVAFGKLLGPNELAMRAGSLCAALLLACLLIRLLPEPRGFISASLLLAAPMWAGYAHAATPDMLFSASLVTAILFASRWLETGRTRWCMISYGALAFSFLAKGPAGPILFALVVGSYALINRHHAGLVSRQHLAGWAAFIVIGAPWYLLVSAKQGARFLVDFFINHNLRRFTSDLYQHPQPFWFYIVVLALGFLPFTPLLLNRRYPADRITILAALGVFWPALFFSISQCKLPGYVLPAIPFMCVVLSGLPTDRRAARLFAAILMGIVAALAFWKLTDSGIAPVSALLAILPLLATACLLAFPRVALPAAAASLLAGYISLKAVAAPVIESELSSRRLATALAAEIGSRDFILYRTGRATSFGLNYYCGRALPETIHPSVLLSRPWRYALTTEAGSADLLAAGARSVSVLWAHGKYLFVAVTP